MRKPRKEKKVRENLKAEAFRKLDKEPVYKTHWIMKYYGHNFASRTEVRCIRPSSADRLVAYI